MRPVRHASSVCLLAALTIIADAAGQPPPPPQTQPTFRSGTAAIVVDAAVRDRNRRPITRLEANDFQVFDNGVLQQVSQVTYGKLPIDVTVALDISHSVTGDLLNRLRNGVVQLTRDLGRDDRLRLVLFNTQIARTTDFTRDVKLVQSAVRDVPAGGGTALLDAISVALVGASAPDRRQLVVFFTDGSDTSSITASDTLTMVARRTRATLVFVVPGLSLSFSGSVPLGLPSVTSIVRQAPIPLLGLFTELAKETGGSVVPTATGSNLSATFRRVLEDFRSAYVLYYTPRDVDRGGYHTIDVKVNRDGATVQARRGYFGS